MSKKAKTKSGGRTRGRTPKVTDVYEAEESRDEETNLRRFDAVENYQYETPSEFEDEEIDEDMAFTEEDKHQFGDMGMEAPAEDEDLAGEDLREMPESDDEELAASDEAEELEDESLRRRHRRSCCRR
ncbi:hypothetical protein WJX84_005428 [Apatococcus fuscideae]|uniref:Uncharacterized protein n=1 Tax=Apatococcus fuscideae TaxID=2026836 RepID=A0AAW1SE14_9CHLO